MRAWLKSLSKEQLAFAVSLPAALLIGLGALLPDPPPVPETLPPPMAIREAEQPVLEPLEVQAEFASYWRGTDVFQREVTSRAAIPQIPPPLPKVGAAALPAFRPSPLVRSAEVPAARRYPTTANRDWVAAEALLQAGEFEKLKTLQEPVVPPLKDRRAEREREFDVVFFHNRESREGTYLGEDGTSIRLRSKEGNRIEAWPKADVKRILRNWTNEERYRRRSNAIRRGSSETAERIELAQWCRERGMLPEARAELGRALEIDKGNAGAIFALGSLLELLGRLDEAVRLYHESIPAAAPRRFELSWRIGECLGRLGHWEAAGAAYQQSAQSSRFVRGRISYAATLVRLGDPAAAVEIVSACFREFARDRSTLTEELEREALVVRGRARLVRGEIGKAMEDFQAAIRSPGPGGAIAHARNGLGVCHASRGEYPQAVASFAEAIRADQYRIEAWTNLATLYLLAGREDDARALFEAAVQRDPTDVSAGVGPALSWIRAAEREIDESKAASAWTKAREIVEEARAAAPRDAYVSYLAGVLSVRRGDLDGAAGLLGDALRKDRTYVPAIALAGNLCLRRAVRDGRSVEAVRASLERAAGSFGVFGPYLGRILRSVSRLGPESLRRRSRDDAIRALSFLRSVEGARPKDPDLSVALGCTMDLLNRGEEARERFMAAKAWNNAAGRRPDPLIEYALGSLEVRFGKGDIAARLLRAQAYFRSAESAQGYDDAESRRVIAQAGTLVREIDEWRVTSVLEEENFQRPDAENLRWPGSRWIEEDQPPRVPIVLRGGRCLFTGKPADNMILSRLERDGIRPDQFYRLEATLVPEAQVRVSFEFGLSLYDPAPQPNAPRSGVHVGFDMRRKLRQVIQSDKELENERSEMSGRWREIKIPFALPGEIRVRVDRVEVNRAHRLAVSLFDPKEEKFVKVVELPMRQYGRTGGTLKVSFWARGWHGEAFALAVDDVRILERRRR